MIYLVTTSRWLTGLLFIFSGLIKANDPLGFSYKLEEYFQVFGMEWMVPTAVVLSVIICAVEIILGIALLIGARIKLVAWGLLLMIVFFTFLTFYSAYFNKVTDCGCFGDAIKLTPWQSFWKDIVLLVWILIIFLNKEKIKPIFALKTENYVLALVTFLSFGFGIYTTRNLPIIDFLPYKIGNNIPALMQIPDGAEPDEYAVMYTLRNASTGEEKKMDDKEYISSGIWEDENWELIATSDPILVKKGFTPAIIGFQINDAQGTDYTNEIIANPFYNLIIVSYDLNKTNQKAHQKLSELTIIAEEEFNIRTVALTSATAVQAETFRHELNLFHEFFFADATPLKSMVRSNPGLILMKNGTVINKWSSNSLPDYQELKEKYFDKD